MLIVMNPMNDPSKITQILNIIKKHIITLLKPATIFDGGLPYDYDTPWNQFRYVLEDLLTKESKLGLLLKLSSEDIQSLSQQLAYLLTDALNSIVKKNKDLLVQSVIQSEQLEERIVKGLDVTEGSLDHYIDHLMIDKYGEEPIKMEALEKIADFVSEFTSTIIRSTVIICNEDGREKITTQDIEKVGPNIRNIFHFGKSKEEIEKIKVLQKEFDGMEEDLTYQSKYRKIKDQLYRLQHDGYSQNAHLTWDFAHILMIKNGAANSTQEAVDYILQLMINVRKYIRKHAEKERIIQNIEKIDENLVESVITTLRKEFEM